MFTEAMKAMNGHIVGSASAEAVALRGLIGYFGPAPAPRKLPGIPPGASNPPAESVTWFKVGNDLVGAMHRVRSDGFNVQFSCWTNSESPAPAEAVRDKLAALIDATPQLAVPGGSVLLERLPVEFTLADEPGHQAVLQVQFRVCGLAS